MRYQGLSTIACTVLSLAGGASAKILWDPVGDTCKDFARSVGQPDLDSAVKKLWGDIENMATYAHDMMDKAESGSISDPWKRLRILGTYDVFFNGQHSDSQQRWNSVKSTLDTMKSASGTDFVYMMCDDAYMYTEQPDGNIIWNTPHNQNWHLSQGKDQITCAKANDNGKNLIAYRQGWVVHNADHPSYVVICAKHNSGDIYLDNLSFKSGDSLDQYTTLTTTLFHEFLHVLIPNMRGDSAGGTAAGGERYQVIGTQEVRSTYAPENPDSVTLFALSLAIDDYYFLTTKAETKQEVWTRFNNEGQTGQNIIQSFGLTQP